MGNDSTIHRSRGNVVADLGVADAGLRLAKAHLERLERCLQGLDTDIAIRVQPRSARRARAKLTVEYVPA